MSKYFKYVGVHDNIFKLTLNFSFFICLDRNFLDLSYRMRLSSFVHPNAPDRYRRRNWSKPLKPKSPKNLWMTWEGFSLNLSFTVKNEIVNLHEIRVFIF